MSPHRWLVAAAGGASGALVACCALQAAAAANAVGFALIMRHAVDSAVAGLAEAFFLSAALFGAALLLQVCLHVAIGVLSEEARAALDNRLRMRAFRGVLAQDYARVSGRHTADIMNRMTSDVTAVSDGAVSLASSAVSAAVRSVGALGVVFALAPGLAAVFLAAGVFAAACSALLRGRLKRLSARVQEAEGLARMRIQECLDNLLVVRSFGCEEKVARRSADDLGAWRRARRAKAGAGSICSGGMSLVSQVAFFLGFAWCGAGILAGTASYGTLVAVIQLVGQIQRPLSSLGGMASKHASLLASVERLMELDAPPQPRLGAAKGEGGADGVREGGWRLRVRECSSAECGSAQCDAVDRGAVERGSAECGLADCDARALYAHLVALRFEEVSFSYGAVDGSVAAQAVRDLTFSLAKGSFMLLEGASGAGKSTVMKLLMGAYAPDVGCVLADCGRFSVGACRFPSKLFAYVPQGNGLMAGTIQEAVSFACEDGSANEEKVRAACAAACADEFIERLPQGYDTVLGEGGSGLSEGQMQRLAVARAVCSGAPVLLLDEATSALDAATERRMLERLRRLPGRTALVASHREQARAVCDETVRLGGR